MKGCARGHGGVGLLQGGGGVNVGDGRKIEMWSWGRKASRSARALLACGPPTGSTLTLTQGANEKNETTAVIAQHMVFRLM